jgi:hypothetical protein
MAISQKIAGNERIRGPNLALFIPHIYGAPMEEAIRKADEAGLVIASNKRLDKALKGNGEWRSKQTGFISWSGTMTAYDKPDQRLGKTIVYDVPKSEIRYVFPVPEEHQGKKNIILVAEHPEFSLVKDGNDRIIQATDIGAVERFPLAMYGWYLADPRYGIPHGDTANDGRKTARYLARREKRVGLVVRCTDVDSYIGRRVVDLWSRLSEHRGVIVEAPVESG